jgi:hypothetical protein
VNEAGDSTAAADVISLGGHLEPGELHEEPGQLSDEFAQEAAEEQLLRSEFTCLQAFHADLCTFVRQAISGIYARTQQQMTAAMAPLAALLTDLARAKATIEHELPDKYEQWKAALSDALQLIGHSV